MQKAYIRDNNARFGKNVPDLDIGVERLTMPDPVAALAFSMIERWGMVAALDGGEDSTGRAKLSLSPVGDLVSRAFNAAELAYQMAEERGHLTKLPSREEAEASYIPKE